MVSDEEAPLGASGESHTDIEPHDLPPEHPRAQPGRVDHEIRPRLEGGEQVALGGHALGNPALGGERMTAAGLLVAVDQGLLVGVEEQHVVAESGTREVVEDCLESLEVVTAADVGDDRRMDHLRPVVEEQLDQAANQPGREVVDAEVPGILEDVHRGRLTGSREPRDDHQVAEVGRWGFVVVGRCPGHSRSLACGARRGGAGRSAADQPPISRRSAGGQPPIRRARARSIVCLTGGGEVTTGTLIALMSIVLVKMP